MTPCSQDKGVDVATATAPAARTLSFGSVYQAELAHVWKLLRFLGVPAKDLEDVTHDVFVTLYRRWADLDPGRPVRPWLNGIAFRVASDYRRRAHNYRELMMDVAESADHRPDAQDQLEAKRAYHVLLAALEQMSFEQRVVFVLHEIEEHSMVEVAEMLSEPLNTLYSRLRRARERFTDVVRSLEHERVRP